MLIGIVYGAVTPKDLDGFRTEINAANALRYRNIIDVMGASSGPTAEGLAAFRERVRQRGLPPQHGPIALVANKELAGLARAFAQLMGDERPVEVFPNIHAARRWLDQNS